MSLENIGIGGILSFNGAEAITGMNAVTLAAMNMNRGQKDLADSSGGLGTSLGMLGGQLQGLGTALMPFTEAVETAIGEAAKFQDSIQALKVTSGAGADAVGKFAEEALHFSTNSVISATEIAKGMAELSKAGATNNEVMEATPSIINSATVAQLELGKVATLTSGVIRSFNLDFSDTAHVSDVMTLVAAHTTGGFQALGESLKYVGATSNMLGINLSTTSALMSVMADSGLKGSSAGMQFSSMIERLLKPSKEAAGWLKANHVEMKKFADGSLDAVGTLTQITGHIDAYKDVVKRAYESQVLFGVRGAKTFNLIRESIVNGRLPELMREIAASSEGAAARMAQIRVDDFTQQLKIAENAVEAFGIRVGGPLLGPVTETLKKFTYIVGGVVDVLGELQHPTGKLTEMQREYGTTIVAVAQGINDAITTVLHVWGEVKPAIMNAISAITGTAGPDLIREITKWATTMFMVAAAIAPILVGVGGLVAFVVTVAAPAFEGLAYAAVAIGAALMGVMAIGTVVFASMASDGESTGSVIQRAFNVAKEASDTFVNEGLYPVIGALVGPLHAAFEGMGAHAVRVALVAKTSFQEMFGYVIRQSPIMKDVFTIATSIMSSAATNLSKIFVGGFHRMLSAIEPVTNALKEMALWLMQHVMKGMRDLAKAAITIADATGISKGSAGWAAVAGIASQTDEDLDATSGKGKLASIHAAQNAGKEQAPEVYNPGEPGDHAADIDLMNGAGIGDNLAKRMEWSARHQEVKVGVDIKDQRKIDISNCMTVDGRSMAVATGKYKQEINERSGFRATPWQRRQIVETGAAPGPGGY